MRFKRDGIDGSGISTLMSDAGLTNGAFYAHFASTDDLVAHVMADQVRTQVASYGTLRPGRAGLEDLVREYLSPAHRDHPGTGWPSAALFDEIDRCAGQTKQAYTGARDILDTGLYTMLVETLQLSRALSGRKFADEVLEEGIENTLIFMR
jgi:AcrR family transcriptional regulator